jgi:hypothetical protein
LYVDAANPNSYVSASTTWRDISRGGNNGTLVNGPTFNGANGGSIVFDGVDDYVSVAYSTNIDPTSAITIEAWVYPTDLTTIRYQELYRKEVSPGRHLFSFQEYGTILSFGTWGSSYSELDVPITSSNYLNKWNHFIATYTSGYKAIYANSVLIGLDNTITGGLVAANSTSYIGSAGGGSELFKGNYACFRMYGKALTSHEVLQNFNATRARFGI